MLVLDVWDVVTYVIVDMPARPVRRLGIVIMRDAVMKARLLLCFFYLKSSAYFTCYYCKFIFFTLYGGAYYRYIYAARFIGIALFYLVIFIGVAAALVDMVTFKVCSI